MSENATVFIVDDDAAVRLGVSRLLRAAGIGTADFPHAHAFLDSGHCSDAGCLVLDVDMPGLSGVELQRVLAERHCLLPIVFVTGHGDISMGVQAMKYGAADFLTKPLDSDRLLAAVQAAIERNRAARAARASMDTILQRLATLTPRELEVLPLVVAGQMNKQVAARLGTAEKTIKVHRARVMQKLQVRTLAGLVRLADRVGIGAPAP
jgi:FixJ family two-component response regulator